MYVFRCLTVFGLLALLIACDGTPSAKEYEGGLAESSVPMLLVASDATTEDLNQSKEDRKIIRNGELVFEVGDIYETRRNIQDIITRYEGYISSEREFSYSNRTSVSMVARVDASRFDRLLADVSKSAITIDEKEVSNKDVTEEFLDVETRLKNKKTLEKRYLELLQSAKTVKDILEIEKEIGALREDIEAVEGRLNYLKDQTSMSTLSMTFYVTKGQSSHFFRSIGNGFRNGWDNLGWFLVGLVNVWPFLILLFMGVWGIRRWRKK